MWPFVSLLAASRYRKWVFVRVTDERGRCCRHCCYSFLSAVWLKSKTDMEKKKNTERRTERLYVFVFVHVALDGWTLQPLNEVRGRLPAFCNHTGRVQSLSWRLIWSDDTDWSSRASVWISLFSMAAYFISQAGFLGVLLKKKRKVRNVEGFQDGKKCYAHTHARNL